MVNPALTQKEPQGTLESIAKILEIPQPRTDFWAFLESSGLWLATLLIGMILMLAMLLAMQRTEAQLFRDARLALVLQEMRESVESELALGLELADIGQARNLLENALIKDPSLHSADVMDAQGLLMFSTDRGLVGESVPKALIAAAQQQTDNSSQSPADAMFRPRYWTSADEDEGSLGLPIRNPFSQTVGYISVTAMPVEKAQPTWIGWAALGLVVVVSLLGGLAAIKVSHRDYQNESAQPLQGAASVLHATRLRQQSALERLIADQEQAL